MKSIGVVITTDNQVKIKTFADPLWETLGKAVGGYIECTFPDPARMSNGRYYMIVNEDGLLKGLPVNLYGCYLYGTDQHGNPIVGNVVIMKPGFRDGVPDIVGLTDVEAFTICRNARTALEHLLNIMSKEAQNDSKT